MKTSIPRSLKAARQLFDSIPNIDGVSDDDAEKILMVVFADFIRKRDRDVHNAALWEGVKLLREQSKDIADKLPLYAADRGAMANSILELQRDDCVMCHGEERGTPGNENIINEQKICDTCHGLTITNI